MSSILLNNSLPLNIKVLEKTSYNRYLLKFGNTTLSTKSLKELVVDCEYWGEISQNGNLISVSNLIQKPNIGSLLENGASIIEKIIYEQNFDFFHELCVNMLVTSEDREHFDLWSDIFMALSENTIHIPFVYNGLNQLFQLRKIGNRVQIYLIFLNYGPIMFTCEKGKIIHIKTPYNTVLRLLSGFFDVDIKIDSSFDMLWKKNSSFLDFKG